MKEIIAKISEILKAKGLDAEAVDEAVDEAVAQIGGEGEAEEAETPTEETPEAEKEEPTADEPQEEGETEEETPKAAEELAQAIAQQQLPEGAEEVDPTKIGEPGPNQDIEQFKADNEELRRAIEGLLARIASLEEALQASGVLQKKEGSAIGVDQSRTPANNPQDDPLEDILNEINRGRR